MLLCCLILSCSCYCYCWWCGGWKATRVDFGSTSMAILVVCSGPSVYLRGLFSPCLPSTVIEETTLPFQYTRTQITTVVGFFTSCAGLLCRCPLLSSTRSFLCFVFPSHRFVPYFCCISVRILRPIKPCRHSLLLLPLLLMQLHFPFLRVQRTCPDIFPNPQ